MKSAFYVRDSSADLKVIAFHMEKSKKRGLDGEGDFRKGRSA